MSSSSGTHVSETMELAFIESYEAEDPHTIELGINQLNQFLSGNLNIYPSDTTSARTVSVFPNGSEPRMMTKKVNKNTHQGNIPCTLKSLEGQSTAGSHDHNLDVQHPRGNLKLQYRDDARPGSMDELKGLGDGLPRAPPRDVNLRPKEVSS